MRTSRLLICLPPSADPGARLTRLVFMNEHTPRAALLAAGTTLACVEAIARGDVRAAVALVWPPGHHAQCGCAMGFCTSNNAAARCC